MSAIGHLGADETIELAILGAARDRSLEIDEIVACVRQLVGTRWQPTNDVIVGRVRHLLSEGFLDAEPFPDANGRGRGRPDILYRTPATGRLRLEELLKMKVSGLRSPPGSVCIALKVCLLEALRHDDRASQIEELIELHEEEIDRLGEVALPCRPAFGFAKRWLVHELDHLRSEIAWLRELLASVGVCDRSKAAK